MKRECKKCGKEKEITLFRKRKKWFSHTCKECYASQYRTGIPNIGRFQKGHKKGNGRSGKPSPLRGRKLSKKTIEKIAAKLRGRKLSDEHISKIKIGLQKRYTNHIYSECRRGAKSIKWSLEVRSRDGNKCRKCNKTKKLHAHHIIPWKQNKELRFDVNNGITLCNSCHKKEEPFQIYWLGKKFSEEHKKKLSDAKKGKIPWNKGIKNS